MTQWAYMTVQGITEAELNDHGSQGWELVNVTQVETIMDVDTGSEEEYVSGVMKRATLVPQY